MNDNELDLHLGDAHQTGVYLVPTADLDALAAAARSAQLQIRRIDLSGCHHKTTLLLRLAVALDFPSDWGRNWDALAELLRDLDRPAANGHALFFEDADQLRATLPQAFDTLVAILLEAAQFWAEVPMPFWAFLAVSDPDISPRRIRPQTE